MTRIEQFKMVTALAVVAVVAPAFAGNVPVGRFYSELAQAKGLVAVDALSAEASLRAAGFNLPKLALDKRLTEGDMTSISTSFGLRVTTENPSQLITETQLNTYMASFGNQIAVRPLTGGAIGPAPALNGGDHGIQHGKGKGKGKKKGHHHSASSPI